MRGRPGLPVKGPVSEWTAQHAALSIGRRRRRVNVRWFIEKLTGVCFAIAIARCANVVQARSAFGEWGGEGSAAAKGVEPAYESSAPNEPNSGEPYAHFVRGSTLELAAQ